MFAVQAQNSSGVSATFAAEFTDGAAKNNLIGALIALALYGVFFVLFCATLHVLCIQRTTARFNYPLLTASIAIFAFTTTDTILKSHRLLVGLLYTPSPYTPDTYFPGSFDWPYVLEDAVIVLNMLTADAVLLYRVWIVWGRRWQVVAVNVLLWLGFLATCVQTLQVQVETVRQPAEIPLQVSLGQWTIISQSLSLVQTVTSTGLLAGRLWRVNRAASRYKQSSFVPVIRILVESGAIYALLLLAFVLVLATGLPESALVMQLISPTIGITFSLIIVRVGLDLTGDKQTTTRASGGDTRPSQTINISVRRDVESEATVQVDDISGFEDGKDIFAMRRLDSVSSHTV